MTKQPVQLTGKDQTLYTELFNFFHNKNYKKGIKVADQLLAKHPDHGETMCMKALMLHSTSEEHKTEAYDLMKKGLLKNMTGHICWHINGLIYRADRNYEQALKCYSLAHQRNEDDLNILRDLAVLQAHLRLYPDLVISRRKLLRRTQLAQNRQNWIALAVAYHLNGQHEETIKVLTAFENTLGEVPSHDYERSEIALYHATVLEEMGRTEDALSHLETFNGEIVDRESYSVLRAQLLLKIGRLESAEWAWSALLNNNPDSEDNVRGFLASKGCKLESPSDADREKILKVLDEVVEKHAGSLAVRRMTLDFAVGDDFKRRTNTYVTRALRKGIPSIFNDIKPLYDDAEKRTSIQDLIEGYRTAYEASGSVSGDEETIDTPVTYIWLLLFISQHYSILDRHSKALDIIHIAIGHTPTLPDLHMFKARILKRAGNPVEAEKAITTARNLDGQDRFLNSKAVKYLLRADQIEEAERVVGLFTRAGLDPVQDLKDLQCFWFLQEEGDAYRRKGNLAMALKRYHDLEEAFGEMEEDQYDFHQYSIRKFTLRSYITLLRWEDKLRSHRAFLKASQSAVEIYLELDKNPQNPQPPPEVNGVASAPVKHETNGISDEEKRKQAKKEAKAKAKAKAHGVAAEKKESKADAEDARPKDDDPHGHKLLTNPKPLEAALKFVKFLERQGPHRIETWLLAFDVAFRQKKLLKALTALRRAHEIDAGDATHYVQTVELKTLVESSSDLSPPVIEAVKSNLETLFPWPSIDAANGEILQRHSGSPAHIFAAARALALQNGDASEAIDSLVLQIPKTDTKASLEVATRAFVWLKERNSVKLDEYRSDCEKKFPLSSTFKARGETESVIPGSGLAAGEPDESKEILDP